MVIKTSGNYANLSFQLSFLSWNRPRNAVTISNEIYEQKKSGKNYNSWEFIPSILKLRQQGTSYVQCFASVDFLSLLAFYFNSFKRQHYVDTFLSLSVINTGHQRRVKRGVCKSRNLPGTCRNRPGIPREPK